MSFRFAHSGAQDLTGISKAETMLLLLLLARVTETIFYFSSSVSRSPGKALTSLWVTRSRMQDTTLLLYMQNWHGSVPMVLTAAS